MCLSDPEVGDLRQEALSILMASDLVSSDDSSSALGPGSTQYLLSLARLALSAGVEIPDLWGGPQLSGQLLQCLLRCPQYEVRELALEGILRRLQEEEEEEEEEEEKKKKRRPQWLDETTLSNLTSLALHETHPQCLAKVRPHTHTHTHTYTHMHTHTNAHKSIRGGAFVCCVHLKACIMCLSVL